MTSTTTTPGITSPAQELSTTELAAIVKQLDIRDIVDAGIDSERQVIAGESIVLSSNNFNPKEKVQILLGTSSVEILEETNAKSDGTASVSVVIPDAFSGKQTLAMYAPGSGHGYRTNIVVLSPEGSSTLQTLLFIVFLVTTAIILFFIFRRRQSQK